MRNLVTTQQAAEVLDVPADLIYLWKHRGKVTPAGMLRGRSSSGMQPLYHLTELRPLADAYHRRQAATRRTNPTSNT